MRRRTAVGFRPGSLTTLPFALGTKDWKDILGLSSGTYSPTEGAWRQGKYHQVGRNRVVHPLDEVHDTEFRPHRQNQSLPRSASVVRQCSPRSRKVFTAYISESRSGYMQRRQSLGAHLFESGHRSK